MKLLFICNAEIVDNEIRCASWIRSILTYISEDFDIAIATGGESNHSKTIEIGGRLIRIMTYTRLKAVEELSRILKNENADVTVLFGTETSYTHQVLEISKTMRRLQNVAVFAQGLCCVCAQHYVEGVPERIVKRYTFRDLMRHQNIAKERKSFVARAGVEKTALELTQHFIGRTTMDKAILRMYNQTANYYKCNDVLRSSFYDGQWKYDACQKHRIFISQYYYPLKGFHYLLEAVAQLKDKYPDIKIAAAGYNPVHKSLTKKELKDSSYIRFIKSLVKKHQLQDYIELLGELSEERMKEEYLMANVFVMPSTIENSPNSLAEAMMLGVPTVASDVGGVTDFAVHKKEAYIYPSSATYLLAHYIDEIFSCEDKAEILGLQGKERAELEYNRERNISRFEEIMKRIAGL